jgi:hypothetical protein
MLTKEELHQVATAIVRDMASTKPMRNGKGHWVRVGYVMHLGLRYNYLWEPYAHIPETSFRCDISENSPNHSFLHELGEDGAIIIVAIN